LKLVVEPSSSRLTISNTRDRSDGVASIMGCSLTRLYFCASSSEGRSTKMGEACVQIA
jgi:hypothetical protein